MSTVKKVALKLAQENPEFRRAILGELKAAMSKEHRVSSHQVPTPTFKNARVIPLDKSSLRSLTTRLEKRLVQAFRGAIRTKSDDPIRRQEIWARETHDIRNVMGDDLTVDVLVTAGKDRSGGPFVAAGGYGHNRQTNRPVVIVKLNGSYSPKEYLPAVETGILTRGIYDILIHEMTHAADALIKAKYKTGPASGQYVPDDISAYYNDPKEIRAYMQQIVDEVLRYGGKRKNLEKLLNLFKGPRHRGIEVVLNNTETWPEIKGHLTNANKAKILKSVYQALDEEGYLKSASIEKGNNGSPFCKEISTMSTVKKVALKLAQENPEFRRALVAELLKEAAPPKAKMEAARKVMREIAKKLGKDPERHVFSQKDFEKASKGDKDVLRLLETEFTGRIDVLPGAKKKGADKKKTKAVRRAFNALADASFDLKAAQRSADLKGDAQFAKLVKQVDTLTQNMMKHLNQHYLWD